MSSDMSAFLITALRSAMAANCCCCCWCCCWCCCCCCGCYCDSPLSSFWPLVRRERSSDGAAGWAGLAWIGACACAVAEPCVVVWIVGSGLGGISLCVGRSAERSRPLEKSPRSHVFRQQHRQRTGHTHTHTMSDRTTGAASINQSIDRGRPPGIIRTSSRETRIDRSIDRSIPRTSAKYHPKSVVRIGHGKRTTRPRLDFSARRETLSTALTRVCAPFRSIGSDRGTGRCAPAWPSALGGCGSKCWVRRPTRP